MIPMTVKEFDSLSRRDFDNGAVTDEIRLALQERERLLEQQAQPDYVMYACHKCGETGKIPINKHE